MLVYTRPVYLEVNVLVSVVLANVVSVHPYCEINCGDSTELWQHKAARLYVAITQYYNNNNFHPKERCTVILK